jgi:hypothetical protein
MDLLITDVGLRALRPELKVLFITGYAENAARVLKRGPKTFPTQA